MIVVRIGTLVFRFRAFLDAFYSDKRFHRTHVDARRKVDLAKSAPRSSRTLPGVDSLGVRPSENNGRESCLACGQCWREYSQAHPTGTNGQVIDWVGRTARSLSALSSYRCSDCYSHRTNRVPSPLCPGPLWGPDNSLQENTHSYAEWLLRVAGKHLSTGPVTHAISFTACWSLRRPGMQSWTTLRRLSGSGRRLIESMAVERINLKSSLQNPISKTG